jgi:hypothetical protein
MAVISNTKTSAVQKLTSSPINPKLYVVPLLQVSKANSFVIPAPKKSAVIWPTVVVVVVVAMVVVVVVGAAVVVVLVVVVLVVVVVVVVGLKSSITEFVQGEFIDVKRTQVVSSSTVHKPKEPIDGKNKLVQSTD